MTTREAGLPGSSEALYQDLCALIPGGVNSPFRGYQEVGGTPTVFVRGAEARVWDPEGRSYIDYLGAWGPLILGHGHRGIATAVKKIIDTGWLFGASHPSELTAAQAVREAMPWVDMIRFVNSGAEAVSAALRLARGATGRSKVVRLLGHYHGHVESVLEVVGPEGRGQDPLRWGVPRELADLTLTAPWNDAAGLAKIFDEHGPDIAALILEPVTGSMGVTLPVGGFLEACRDLTRRHGAVLIFDEVLTGFRIARGGAAERFGVQPDLVCLGKALAGGFAVGAYGGRRDLMSQLAPCGTVYQAGTFSGNPVSMAACAATLAALAAPGVYPRLEQLADRLAQGLTAAAREAGVSFRMPRCGSMFSLQFSGDTVNTWEEFQRMPSRPFAEFFHAMLDQGHLFPPSHTDAAVLSAAHAEGDIDATIAAARSVLAQMPEEMANA